MSASQSAEMAFLRKPDLATLCGADVAIVVNSPAGNLLPPGSSTLYQEYRRNVVQELNMKCMVLSRRKDIAIARKSMLESRLKALVEKNPVCKMAEGAEGLGLTELKQLEEVLKWLKMRTYERISKLMRGRGASSSNAIIPANPARIMNQFALGTGQTFFPDNLGYGRGH